MVDSIFIYTEVLLFLMPVWCMSAFDVFTFYFQQMSNIELIISWQAE